MPLLWPLTCDLAYPAHGVGKGRSLLLYIALALGLIRRVAPHLSPCFMANGRTFPICTAFAQQSPVKLSLFLCFLSKRHFYFDSGILLQPIMQIATCVACKLLQTVSANCYIRGHKTHILPPAGGAGGRAWSDSMKSFPIRHGSRFHGFTHCHAWSRCVKVFTRRV